jgi:hypothetical protein
LNLARCHFAFCEVLDGDVCSGPFFIVERDPNYGCVGNVFMPQQDCFKFGGGDLEGVDFDEFLEAVSNCGVENLEETNLLPIHDPEITSFVIDCYITSPQPFILTDRLLCCDIILPIS